MFENEKEKREVLAYTLLALSLMLYVCWKKKKSSESMKSGYMYAEPRLTDGFRPNSIMSALDFGKSDKKTPNKSLNELESYVVNRHEPKESFRDQDFTSLRWVAEGFNTADADTVGEDVLTPIKVESTAKTDITTSGMQLMHSDNTSHYVPKLVTI